jgi:hypothetical protein
MAGEGSSESAQFFLSCLTGKTGADKTAQNLVTPKQTFQPQSSFGHTGILKTTFHQKKKKKKKNLS